LLILYITIIIIALNIKESYDQKFIIIDSLTIYIDDSDGSFIT